MASWITHLMIADNVLEYFPQLHRKGFCVGNIAPDCNIENEDWTKFTPSREITHWMQGQRKQASDCDTFYNIYLQNRINDIESEEFAFLLGYYSHLVTDAAYQEMIRDENRVKAVWKRIRADVQLNERSRDMDETWDSVKKLISKNDMKREIDQIEAEYLINHPDSGYLTEILPLKAFPDYIDYLPHGCIVRKIGIMGKIPERDISFEKFVSISRSEYSDFIERTVRLVISSFEKIYSLRERYENEYTNARSD